MKVEFKRAPYLLILWFAAVAVFWLYTDTKMRLLFKTFGFNALLIGIILASAWIIGNRVRHLLKDDSDGIEGFLTAMGLGLGVDIAVLFALGMVGLLYRELLLVLIGAPLILSVSAIRKFFESKPWERDFPVFSPSGLEWVIVISLITTGGLVLLSAFVPEIFYDSLYYHDAFPLLYLIRHKMEIYPNAVHSAMPSNIDLLYVLPLAFSKSEAVRLLHIAFYAGAGGWVYVLAKRFFGTMSALVALALWATIPGVCWMAGLGAVDMGVTFFSIGAMSTLLRWVLDKKKGKSALVVSAILLGLAVGSKYSALMVGAMCAIWAAMGVLKRRDELGVKDALVSLLIYGGISIAVASPWYIRSWIIMGSPLYPTLSAAGSPGAWALNNLKRDSQVLYPISQTFTVLPKDLWVQKGQFGAGSLLGLGVLAMIPAIIWGWFRRGSAAWIALGVFLLYVMWARSILIVRYLYPCLALGAALAGGMLVNASAPRWRKTVVGAFLIMVSVYNYRAITVFYESVMGDIYKYLSSAASPEDYLDKYTQVNPAGRFVRENLPPDAKMFFVGEAEGFYYYRDYLPVSAYDIHPLQSWIKQVADGAQLRELLINKGFTHLVLSRPHWQRMKHDYNYLILTEDEEKLFEGMVSSLNLLYKDSYVEVYAL